jgi:hypothetical protein
MVAMKIEVLLRGAVPVVFVNANLSPNARKEHILPSLGDTRTHFIRSALRRYETTWATISGISIGFSHRFSIGEWVW